MEDQVLGKVVRASWLRLPLSVFVGLVAMFATALPASALPYDGQDPMASGCASSAYTVLSAPIKIIPMYGSGTVGTLELRYSSQCGTNWGRVTTSGGAVRLIQVNAVRQSDGYTQYESGYYATAWTNMVYGYNLTVCVDADMYGPGWAAHSDPAYLCA